MATHELLSQKKGSLEEKLPVAEVEQILNRWAQQIDDNCTMVTFDANQRTKATPTPPATLWIHAQAEDAWPSWAST